MFAVLGWGWGWFWDGDVHGTVMGLPTGHEPRGGADRLPSSKNHIISSSSRGKQTDTQHRHIFLSYLHALGLDKAFSGTNLISVLHGLQRPRGGSEPLGLGVTHGMWHSSSRSEGHGQRQL